MVTRTREQLVRGTAAIWAIPKTKWELERDREEDPNSPPFRLEIRTDRAWTDGAVKLYESEVSMILPGDIDILRRAIETLREAKETERRNFEEKMSQLDNQINNLLLLEHTPEVM